MTDWRMEKEELRLERMLANGELTDEEFTEELRELRLAFNVREQEAAERFYDY